MAEIRPFKGIHYGAADLGRVLAPPYDVIPPPYQDELYARDPHNIVRVVLNRTPGDAGYEEAGQCYARWLSEGVLQQDEAPALYVLEQTFANGDGKLRRFGLLARFRAEDAERRIILPHEHTRAAAKEDRWKVLNATRANFSPIFLMFPDPERRFGTLAQEAMAPSPIAVYTDDGGVSHRLWRVSAEARDRRLPGRCSEAPRPTSPTGTTATRRRSATAMPRARTAPGRSGTSRRWACRACWCSRITGSWPRARRSIRPSRSSPRVSAPRAWRARSRRPPPSPPRRRPTRSRSPSRAGGALVAEALPGSEALLDAAAPPSLRALDTYFLHHAVLGPLLAVPDAAVSYVHSLKEAEDALASRACRLAVLMRATPVQQIVDVAEASESMPAKSTFFHPKLPSGLVIHPLVV